MVNSKITFHIQRSTFKLFWKKDKKTKEAAGGEPRSPRLRENEAGQGRENITPKEFGQVGAEEIKKQPVASSKISPKEYGILKGFYVSEKATSIAHLNQYVFKVFDNVTKNEVKKQVEKSFGVKVKGVKVINLPKKTRTLGRHTGFKSGFKKAIVILEKGYTIDQAKA